MLFTALCALSLAAAAAAQQTVQVGATSTAAGGVFQFIPPSINATKGSVVTFQFSGDPGNHTVTQSTFSSPCNPVAGGFDSGWVFIRNPLTDIPEFNITITDDTKPIWYYCKQLLPSPHCSSGMVGAINAPATGNTFTAFQAAARSFSGAPGQGVGNLVGIGASASLPVGPIPSGVSTFGAPTPGSATGAGPTPTAPAPASGSPSAAAPAQSSGAASHVALNSVVAFLAAALGFTMA